MLTGLACEAPALHLPVLGSKACGQVCAMNLGLEGGGHCEGSQRPRPVSVAGVGPFPGHLPQVTCEERGVRRLSSCEPWP